jgi:hypothetical protein
MIHRIFSVLLYVLCAAVVVALGADLIALMIGAPIPFPLPPKLTSLR